ncbi:MAG: AMP-binding protein, partial [Anaerolineales bacterium]|nr:AMP-binding protein [Anaerolineales bacterium]
MMADRQQSAQTLNEAFLNAMDTYAERPCLIVRHGQRFRKISYAHFRALVYRLVAYFHEMGITHGQRVALAADNSLDWLVTYVATLLSGGVIVPLHISLSADGLRTILQDTGARLAVLQRPSHIAAVAAAQQPGVVDRLLDLHKALVIGHPEQLPNDFTLLSTILSGNRPSSTGTAGFTGENPHLRQHAVNIGMHKLATIFYVPGSGGTPRGAVFEHKQVQASLTSAAHIFPFDGNDLLYPLKTWSEVHSLIPTLHSFLHGVPVIALPEDSATLLESLQQTSPTIIFATPHSLESFYDHCMGWLAQQPESNQKVFQWALNQGRIYWNAGTNASDALIEAYRRAELTFFAQLRGQLGGRVRYLYSSGATLPQQLNEFYEAIGIPVLNLYSLTEVGGFPAANRPTMQRAGSVGQVSPGYALRVAVDGELWVHGESLMRGYWRQPEETQNALDDEGWLASGDLGALDEDGFLTITGRTEHLIVLSVGRKVAPATLEEALLQSAFVAETAVFGDNQPYLTALILPDLAAINAHLQPAAPITHTADPQVRQLLDEVVRQVNVSRDRWERVREYALLELAAVGEGALKGNGRHAL